MGRTGYGLALDVFPYRWVMCFETGVLVILMSSLYATVDLGAGAFVAWMYLIYVTMPGIFAVLPGKTK